MVRVLHVLSPAAVSYGILFPEIFLFVWCTFLSMFHSLPYW
jgi:hypothetical protein